MAHPKADTVSGQLFIRNAGDRIGDSYDDSTQSSAPDGSGRDLVMVVGIIALPQGNPLKGEHQYVVLGDHDDDFTQLRVMHDYSVDRTKMAKGMSLGGLVTTPIWRC